MDFPWRIKLRRASEHLEAFDAACSAYAESSDVGFDYETDADVGSIRVRLRANAEPPTGLGAVIGDVLHNLRSALDAIAWASCPLADLDEKKQQWICFPISDSRHTWDSNVQRWLPGLREDHLDVFLILQPWYWDEKAAEVLEKDVAPSIQTHALYRLHDLARTDRHRVPHPVVTRARNTWIGTPEGVVVKALRGDPWPVEPGGVVLEWRVSSSEGVADVYPDGEAILVMSEQDAAREQSASQVLHRMWDAVADALNRVEIAVLQVVTPEQLEELKDLWTDVDQARDAIEELHRSTHTIDVDFSRRYRELRAQLSEAQSRYAQRRSDLFD